MEKQEIEQLISNLFPGALLVETHISWVFLMDDYAYKIKKPVRFSFLDFSTLEKRKYYCEKEVVLNRRLSKDMYLDTIPVYKNGKSFSLKEGEVYDYAVKMRRMDTELEMDKLLEKNRVGSEIIKNLASVVAAFHSTATIVKRSPSIADLQNRFNDITEIQDDCSRLLGEEFSDLIPQMIEQSNVFLLNNNHYIKERAGNGLVRDGHGDLHTGNIFLYSVPVIFDCIEFNDEMRQLDILDEVAFLAMDLESFNRFDLSEIFYHSYMRESGLEEEVQSLHLYQYYKCYRASVRAKVCLIKAVQGNSKQAIKKSADNALRYFQLIKYYLQGPPKDK